LASISPFIAGEHFIWWQLGSHQQITMWPNTSLEPTPITPVSFRYGFRVGGCHRRRGSVLGR
jgi:hypothetical protein